MSERFGLDSGRGPDFRMRPRVERLGIDPRIARLGGLAAVFLVVLLPVLAAGTSVDRPVSPREVAMIESVRGTSTEGDDRAPVLRGSRLGPFQAVVDAAVRSVPRNSSVRTAVVRTRLAALALLLVTSSLVFLAVALALSRGLAALCCIALALSPPLREQGTGLRPEALGLVFAQLGCLVLLFVPNQIRSGRSGSRLFMATLSALSAGACYALCVASVPRQAIAFGVPVTCALFAMVRAGQGFLRVTSRTRFRVLPFRSFRRRTAPFALAAVVTLVGSRAFLRGDPPPISAGSGLWADGLGVELSIRVLMFAGLLGWLSSLLRTWRRRSDLGPPMILFVHAGLLAAAAFQLEPGDDHSLAAVGVSMFVAYGLAIVVFLFGQWRAARLRAD